MYIETEKISNDTTQVNFSGHFYQWRYNYVKNKMF